MTLEQCTEKQMNADEYFKRQQIGGGLQGKAMGSGCRSSVPEDATHQLYSELFERLAHVPADRRSAAIRALVAVYGVKA